MRTSWKVSARAAAARAGVSITRSPAPNTVGWALRRAITSLGVDHVFDVGAHHGEFVRTLRHEAGFTGMITSFEPSEKTFGTLQGGLADDGRWRGMNVALGEQDGSAELHIFSGANFNSVHDLNVVGRERFPALTVDGVETVRVRRLDRVIEELGLDLSTSVVLLKTDTQGHDLDVIRGAGSALDQFAAVLMETAVIPIYEGVPTVDVAIAELREQGFDPAGFFPVIWAADRLRVMEFDALFVNRRFALETEALTD